MSRETDRLVADRGHGLSRAQKLAIRWLATEGRISESPPRAVTWDALERRRLVERQWQWPGYTLTADGRCLAGRMFRMPAGAGRAKTDEGGQR